MIRGVRGETGIRLRMRFQNARLAALGSEPAKLDIHEQCGPGGWPGPHLFLWRRNPCVSGISLTIDLRFYFTYTPTKWNGTGQSNFGRATGQPKKLDLFFVFRRPYFTFTARS